MEKQMDSQAIFNKLKDRNWVKRFSAATTLEHRIALLRAYNTQEKEEEAIIQLLVNKFDPPKPSITAIDQVRKEMEIMEAKGIRIDTKEMEKEWQDKLDAAYESDLAHQKTITDAHILEVQKLLPDIDISMFLPSGPMQITVKHPEVKQKVEEEPKKDEGIKVQMPAALKGSDLKTVEGLTDIAIERLNKANITMKAEFFALTAKEADVILQNPLWTSRFKAQFKPDPGEMI